MIIKDRTLPIIILVIDALLRRLPKNHKQRRYLEEYQSRMLAGYNGEKNLDYYLSLIRSDNLLFFNDLLLKIGQYNFQIDTLIVTKRFLLIIESKNYSGELFFDDTFKQLFRNNNNKKEVLKNPIPQVKIQAIQLRKWLLNEQLPHLPIETLAFISNPKTIINISPNSPDARILCNPNTLLDKIRHLEKYYSKDDCSERDIKKIRKILLKRQTTPSVDILKTYQIEKSEIQTGVQCPSCFALPMVRSKRKWVCPTCQSYSQDAHIQAIYDYFLLINPTITNPQFREFTHLTSRYAAKRMLQSLNLFTTGTKNHTIYYRPNLAYNHQNKKTRSK